MKLFNLQTHIASRNFLLILVFVTFCAFVAPACAAPTHGLEVLPYKEHPIVADKFLKLTSGMSVEQVRSIMGKPDKENRFADVWYVDGSMFNQLKVLYVQGTAVRATWIWLTKGIHHVHFG